MIHVTFQNGQTALYKAGERVWVCNEIIAEEYIAGDHVVDAHELEPGLFVLQGSELEPESLVNSPIKSVRKL